MAEIKLDKSKTALLMADFSAGNMAQNPIVQERCMTLCSPRADHDCREEGVT